MNEKKNKIQGTEEKVSDILVHSSAIHLIGINKEIQTESKCVVGVIV